MHRRPIALPPFQDDPARAETPPGALYTDPDLLALQRERVFARAWHLVGDLGDLPGGPFARPFTLLPGFLDEPLVLTRDASGELRCLSNACTHRGHPVCVAEDDAPRTLRCRYHGRRFHLDGRLASAPGFEGAQAFPRPEDGLAAARLGRFGRLLFVSLDPAVPFETWVRPVRERVGFLDLEAARPDPGAARDYPVRAHWALYCENYLEGFHIPSVHPALAAAVDVRAYRLEGIPHGTLQVGRARDGAPAFTLPEGHPDRGSRVAAWWFFLFPGLMLNFYPGRISVNAVLPAGGDRTIVRYLGCTWPGAPRRDPREEDIDLHRVEIEDEEVVEAVQVGVRARLYRRGRYAPRHEAGVHRFHGLLWEAMGAAVDTVAPAGEGPPPDGASRG